MIWTELGKTTLFSRKLFFHLLSYIAIFLVIEVATSLFFFSRHKGSIEELHGFSSLSSVAFVQKLYQRYTAAFVAENVVDEGKAYKLYIDVPHEYVLELAKIHGGISNAENPTHVTRQNSPLIFSDEKLGYKLRKSVQISCHTFFAADSPNFDPPLIFYKTGSPLSESFKEWIAQNAVLHFKTTTNELGQRITLPDVQAPDKLILVGDSVTFGSGVDDKDTFASNLQRMLGSKMQVVNLGVGGYDADQAYAVAQSNQYINQGHTLVYTASAGDFWHSEDAFDIDAMRVWLQKFNDLKSSGHYKNVIVVLESYMLYSYDHFLGMWSDHWVETTRKGFEEFDKISLNKGYNTINWDTYLRQYNKDNGSIFSGVSLYVDHIHLSPKGNALLAQEIYKSLNMNETAGLH